MWQLSGDPPDRVSLDAVLIGCGKVGSRVLEAYRSGEIPGVNMVGVVVRGGSEDASRRTQELGCAVYPYDYDIRNLKPHLVIEAASAEAFRRYVPGSLEIGADVVALSAAAMANEHVEDEIRRAVEASGATLYLPSGAAVGLDVLQAAQGRELIGVNLQIRITREFASRIGVHSEETGEPIFRGSARGACLTFPTFVNFVATIALASVGLDAVATEVRVDPEIRTFIYELQIVTETATVVIEADLHAPDRQGRTGGITAVSLIQAIRQVTRGGRSGWWSMAGAERGGPQARVTG